MIRALRIALLAAGVLVGLFAVALALGWFLLPRERIEAEAKRQAGRMAGAVIEWKTLTPGFENWALGIRIAGFSARMPAAGPPAVDARVGEIFVRFRLLPLLFRRVEVSAASVRHARLTLVDRGAPPPAAAPRQAPPTGGMALVLPKLDLSDVSVTTRDPFGGGFDLRGIEGSTSLAGALPAVREVEVNIKAESLLWKPSAKEAAVALPGPARLEVSLAGREKGARLEVTRGSLQVGPLRSRVSGTITLQGRGPGGAPDLALRIEGSPQEIRSDAEAFRALAAKVPATWRTTASWNIRIGGSSVAPATEGTFSLKPLRVQAKQNEFAFDELQGNWTTASDQTYKAKAYGGGSGIRLEVEARGSSRPGGVSRGAIFVRAPAARLNGLVPDAPTWESGDVECRALFEVRPPGPPQARWTVTGRGLNGTVPGLPRKVSGFDFKLEGDAVTAAVEQMKLTVGSTTARISGTVTQEKPLGTGTFRIDLDRLVAEEWAPPKGAKPAAAAGAKPSPGPPPPIPLRALTGIVTIGELRNGGMLVRNLVAPVRYEGGALSVTPIRGEIGAGSIEGDLDVRSLLASPSYTLQLELKKAPVEQVAAGILPFRSPVTGLLNGSIQLSGPGLPGPEAVDSLRGALSGNVVEGSLVPSPALTQIQSLLGLSEKGAVAFQTLSHTLRIDRGRLLVDRVKGDLGIDRFDLAGSMGLDQSLDLGVNLSLAPSRVKGGGALASFASYARDAEGRIPLEVRVGGTVLKPTVSIKAGKTLEAAGQKLRQQLGQEIVKGLARRAAGDTLAAPGDSARKDPLKSGREALKRLLGR
jgi:hypothetical protein